MARDYLNTQNDVRERLKKLLEDFPIPISKISREIGLNDKQARYVVQGFVKGDVLYPQTLTALEDYLNNKGY